MIRWADVILPLERTQYLTDIPSPTISGAALESMTKLSTTEASGTLRAPLWNLNTSLGGFGTSQQT